MKFLRKLSAIIFSAAAFAGLHDRSRFPGRYASEPEKSRKPAQCG